MDFYACFQKLGIAPTLDKEVIKKAYANMAAKYHPEEHPEKWMEIHQAYKAALAYAQSHIVPKEFQTDFAKAETNDESENTGLETGFDDLFEEITVEDNSDTEEDFEKREMRKKKVAREIRIIRNSFLLMRKREWIRFYDSEGFKEFCHEDEVLGEILAMAVESKFTFSTMYTIYWHMEELESVLQNEQKYSALGTVKVIRKCLESRWELTPKNKEKLQKRSRWFWKMWMTYWTIPVRYRFWINFLLQMIFLGLRYTDDGIFTILFGSFVTAIMPTILIEVIHGAVQKVMKKWKR